MAGLGKNKNGGTSSSSAEENVTYLPADEWFAKATEEVFDLPGSPVDGILRNLIRMTAEIRTREFGALKSLLGKNLVWLQLVLIDEKRAIQGKIHGIGAKVLPNDPYVVDRSRCLFRETAPCLLRDPERWVFSRSLVFKDYTGLIDEALKFHSYDPVGGLMEPPKDVGTRCTEIFIFVAGDFAAGDGRLNSTEAVQKLLHELTTAEGMRKLHGFDVVAGSARVSDEKIAALKGTAHLSA